MRAHPSITPSTAIARAALAHGPLVKCGCHYALRRRGGRQFRSGIEWRLFSPAALSPLIATGEAVRRADGAIIAAPEMVHP